MTDVDPTREPAAWFVPLGVGRQREGRRPVYALHHAGGGCATFAQLADLLGPEVPVWALNLPGRQARFSEPPRTDLDPLLDELAAALGGETLHTTQRPILFGYCSGALLAFLLARRLRHTPGAPAALVVASYPAPHLARPATGLHLADSDEFWAAVLANGGVLAALAGQPDFREVFEVPLRADYALLAGFRHTDGPPLDIPIVALAGADDPVLDQRQLDEWALHTTGPAVVRRVPGDHWLLETAPAALAKALRAVAADPYPAGSAPVPRHGGGPARP